MQKKYRFFVSCLLTTLILFTHCNQGGTDKTTGSGDYADLVALFKEFRELQKPKVVDGVPDYSPRALSEQRRGLKTYQKRLAAMDIKSWSVSEQVEYQLVRAEMNGLDFYQRVLKPWARDPGFYIQTQAGAGPTRYGAVRVRSFPIPDDGLEDFRTKLKAVPVILKKAEEYLTEGAGDLALCALHYMEGEIAYFQRLSERLEEHHPELVHDAKKAVAAVKEYGAWLKENQDKMTAPAGVGKENYNWWIQKVQLLPYTWDELLDIVMHEDYRVITMLEMERNRNRHLPELKPVERQSRHRRRRDQALRFIMEFLEKEKILTIPDYLSVEQYLDRGPLARPQQWPRERDYFQQTGDREPLPEQTHEFIGHAFDGQRHSLDDRPIRGTNRFYAIDMIRSEGWAFWLEEMLMHAGYLDNRPRRGREIVYLQAAFRTCRAVADLKMHSNDFTLREAIDYCVECAPNGWLLQDGPHVWYEMETNLRFVGWHMGMVVGKVQFMKLLRDYAKLQGDDFNLKVFMDEFLEAGMIPISLIRWEMTGLEDEINTLVETK